MTRYIYKTSLSFGGDIPTAEFEVTASYTVDWQDHHSDSVVEDIQIDFLDGKPGRLCDPMTVETIRDELDDLHWADMLDQALEADADRDNDEWDRRNEDNHERAWAEQ